MWNKSEREGKADQVKGRVKQALGDLSGNTALKAEGQRDEAAGKAKEAVGEVRHKAGDAIEKLGAAVRK
jgi:uncharacterized protein YjbJ (UPF0337 family)